MKIKNFTPCPDAIVEKLGHTAAFVFGMVYRYSQKYGYCTAAQATIAERSRLNRSTVNKYLQILANHDPPFIEDMDIGVQNKPHKYRPLENFSFYVGFTVEKTDTSDTNGVGENDTGVDETDIGVDESNIGVDETNSKKQLKKELKKEREEIPISKNPEAAWDLVRSQIKQDMDYATYNLHLRDTEFAFIENNHFVVCANESSIGWLNDRIKTKAEDLLAGCLEKKMEITFALRMYVSE
jgi:hypothetical protein